MSCRTTLGTTVYLFPVKPRVRRVHKTKVAYLFSGLRADAALASAVSSL